MTINYDEQYQKALELAKAGEGYSEAAEKLLRQGVEKGHGASAYALGSWYLHGVSPIPQDTEAAVELFELAAEKGNPDAWYDLAVCFEAGEGKPQDPSRAAYFYLIAAMLGEQPSIFEAARIMHHGKVDLAKVQNEFTEALLDLSEVLGLFEGE